MADSGAGADTDVIHNILSGEAEQSLFACSHCRRQKVKCDRTLPTCSNCNKSTRECSYPLTVQKPGPKAGTHRRPRPVHGDGSTQPRSSGANGSKKTKLAGIGLSQPQADRNGDKGYSSGKAQTTASYSNTSASPRNPSRSDDHLLKDERLLKLVHPIHDPSEDIKSIDREDEPEYEFQARFEAACVYLSCSPEQGRELLTAYHDYMTSLSLFHQPSFELKIRSIRQQTHLTAFLAALFSYSLRFKHELALTRHSSPSAMKMLDAACQLNQQCLDDCSDDDPPLHLVQSFFIVVWQKLIQGVRGKSWRLLGEVIRIAYELQLQYDCTTRKPDLRMLT